MGQNKGKIDWINFYNWNYLWFQLNEPYLCLIITCAASLFYAYFGIQKVSLGSCLPSCLYFTKNEPHHAYSRHAYKKKTCSWVIFRIWSVVHLFWRKPACESASSFLSSSIQVNLSETIFSISLPRHAVREIGLYDAVSLGSFPSLSSVFITAVVHFLGMFSPLQHLL